MSIDKALKPHISIKIKNKKEKKTGGQFKPTVVYLLHMGEKRCMFTFGLNSTNPVCTVYLYVQLNGYNRPI